jgi:hypothetical protein
MPNDAHLRPPRPRSVLLASWLLPAVAAIAVLDAVVTVSALRRFAGARDAFVAATGVAYLPNLAELHFDLVYDTAIAATAGLTMGLLGIAVRQPSRLARLITCCLAGLITIALIVGFGASPENIIPIDSSAPAAVLHAKAGLLFPWYPAWQSIVAAIEIVMLISAVALLMLSSSGDHYRRLRIDERTDARPIRLGAPK